jgi:hypothetical protein
LNDISWLPSNLSFSQGLLIIAITLVRQGLLAEDVEIAIAQQLESKIKARIFSNLNLFY